MTGQPDVSFPSESLLPGGKPGAAMRPERLQVETSYNWPSPADPRR
ncbi:hypothetical protein [Mycolicibacterium fortuitum]|nr:hypothetical protein [Mycolicibacterium fortuitum]